jgi:hypothetical protein
MAAAVQTVARILPRASQEVVVPHWWRGAYDAVIDPSRFVVNGRGKLSKEDCVPESYVGQEIKAKYDDVGVVHVQNTGLTDMADQKSLAKIIMEQETDYEGGANPRG